MSNENAANASHDPRRPQPASFNMEEIDIREAIAPPTHKSRPANRFSIEFNFGMRLFHFIKCGDAAEAGGDVSRMMRISSATN
jgi:hypothetical protein